MNPVRTGVFALLLAGGVLASFGTEDKKVSLASARVVWGDILRDADQMALQATRMPLQEEVDLGARLASGLQGWSAEDPRDTAYITAVAGPIAAHLRRAGMPYRFHVVESPAVNAFALPGGQVYVLRGMMDFLTTEAELAAILGHEMAHVDLRHCVERYQFQHTLKRVGATELGSMIDVARGLVTIGYNQFQEVEADDQGWSAATQAGYDPSAAEALFSRLEQQFNARPAARDPNSPVEELSRAMEEALSDYFSTHPKTSDRVRRMHSFASRKGQFAGRRFFVGASNYTSRTPRSYSTPPGEWKTY